jgi:hypothetical protein
MNLSMRRILLMNLSVEGIFSETYLEEHLILHVHFLVIC